MDTGEPARQMSEYPSVRNRRTTYSARQGGGEQPAGNNQDYTAQACQGRISSHSTIPKMLEKTTVL